MFGEKDKGQSEKKKKEKEQWEFLYTMSGSAFVTLTQHITTSNTNK